MLESLVNMETSGKNIYNVYFILPMSKVREMGEGGGAGEEGLGHEGGSAPVPTQSPAVLLPQWGAQGHRQSACAWSFPVFFPAW